MDLSLDQTTLLAAFVDELHAWNKKINLSGLSSKKDIIKELLIDSMIPSVYLPDQGRYLDVGSGAGFPGIPLVICKPELEACFIEPNSKKASFLRHVIRLTKLHQIRIIDERIEKSKTRLHPDGYHIITARALAPLPQVLKWSAPHLVSKGLFVNFQGSLFEDALKKSSEILQKNHLSLHRTLPYTLPGKDTQRNILMFVKS